MIRALGGEVRTDLHVFHFRTTLPLGGDLDAAFTGREIVDWIERFGIFDRFVLGNHPPSFFRISTKLPPGEYLDAISALVEGLRWRLAGPALACATCPTACPLACTSFGSASPPFSPPRSENKSFPRIYKGIECDFLIKKKGEISFRPGEKLLARYNSDVSLIAFHFHKTLTYANRLEIAIADLIAAFKWAIDSGMFNILAHPFDVLGRIYREDRRGFEKIASLAREKKVAFEINADKGYEEEAMKALIKNGNLFSFGGDFHALSYWLKREDSGLSPRPGDRKALHKLLGLTAEVSDKEKLYWRELDPLFWHLPYPSVEKRALRNYAVRLYRRCYPDEETFERGLKKVVAKFPAEQGKQRELVESYLQELHRIYTKWGGAPRKDLRMRLEKYFLEVPLTAGEIEVYEQWLAKAYELGLGKDQLLNTWSTPRLEGFLKR